MNDIVIDEQEMLLIISKLDSKIQNLESVYKELDNELKKIDENSNIWNGITRDAAYNKYLTISNNYQSTINQIKSLKVFLETTLDNYLNGDKKINESIEKNEDELKVN